MDIRIQKRILELCGSLRESLNYVKSADAAGAYAVLCDCYDAVASIGKSAEREFPAPLRDEYRAVCDSLLAALEEVNEAVQTGVSTKEALRKTRNALRVLTEKLEKETQIEKKGKIIFFMCVYNTPAGYLREAVNSILGQSDPDLLLLILDHGSTDGTTARILRKFAGEDDRILLFRCEKNMHLNPEDDPDAFRAWKDLWDRVGRESGAEYFAVLDSDDAYCPDFSKEMYAAAKACGAELTVCGTTMVGEDGAVLRERIPPEFLTRRHAMRDTDFIGLYGPLRTLWDKLYSMRWWEWFFGAFFSMVGTNGSDTLISLELMRKIDCLATVPKSLHRYRVRRKSVSHRSPNFSRVERGVQLYLEGTETANSYHCLSPKVRIFLEQVFLSHINDLLDLIGLRAEQDPGGAGILLRRILDEPLYRAACAQIPAGLRSVAGCAAALLPLRGREALEAALDRPRGEGFLSETQKMRDAFEARRYPEALSADTALLLERPLDRTALLYRMKIVNALSGPAAGEETSFAVLAGKLCPDDGEIRREAENLIGKIRGERP